jgi:hypothetical protein
MVFMPRHLSYYNKNVSHPVPMSLSEAGDGTFTMPTHNHTTSDITDFPIIPTKTSQLTNDQNFVDQTALAGFLQSESDPVFVASPAHGITTGRMTQWDTAYKNRNAHASAGYLTAVPSTYATQTWVGEQGYLTAVPSTYATQTWVTDKKYLTAVPSTYATQTWVGEQGYLTAVPSTYATQTWVGEQGYLTAVPDGYATEDFVTGKEYATEVWVTEKKYATELYVTNQKYATKDYVTEKGYITGDVVNEKFKNLIDTAPEALNTLNELAAAINDDANFAGTVTASIATKWTQDDNKITDWDAAFGWGNHANAGYLKSGDLPDDVDLTGYATETWVGEQGYLTAVPSTYATQTWVGEQGYLTAVPSTYATQTWVEEWVEEQDYLTDYTVTQGDVTQYASKINIGWMQIQGDYETTTTGSVFKPIPWQTQSDVQTEIDSAIQDGIPWNNITVTRVRKTWGGYTDVPIPWQTEDDVANYLTNNSYVKTTGTPQAGQAIVWNDDDSRWEPGTVATETPSVELDAESYGTLFVENIEVSGEIRPPANTGVYTINSPTDINLNAASEINMQSPMVLVSMTRAELYAAEWTAGAVAFWNDPNPGVPVFYDGTRWRRISSSASI